MKNALVQCSYGGGKYFSMGNQVGTGELTTASLADGPYGAPAARAVYTAFGELVTQSASDDNAQSRYGYCGAFGYEGLAPSFDEGFDVLADAGLLHVGARCYSPETGRFVQRDRKGILGGMNVYGYVANRPTRHVDPTGLRVWTESWIDSTIDEHEDGSADYVETVHFVTYDDHDSGDMATNAGIGATLLGGAGLIVGGPFGMFAGLVSFELGLCSWSNTIVPPEVVREYEIEGWREPLWW